MSVKWQPFYSGLMCLLIDITSHKALRRLLTQSLTHSINHPLIHYLTHYLTSLAHTHRLTLLDNQQFDIKLYNETSIQRPPLRMV